MRRGRGPGIEIDWVVEEAFAAAPAWHPAVSEVIPVNLRRWRRGFQLAEMGRFIGRLRARRYDLVIDAQGLVKSALLALLTRGPVCGFDYPSARESIASLAYRRHATASWEIHAIDRQRRLFAQALGYPLPETPPDFGLPPPARPARPRLLLLHGTTWETKRWPESHWIELARRANGGRRRAGAALAWRAGARRGGAHRRGRARDPRPAGAGSGDAAPGDRRGQRGRRQ